MSIPLPVFAGLLSENYVDWARCFLTWASLAQADFDALKDALRLAVVPGSTAAQCLNDLMATSDLLSVTQILEGLAARFASPAWTAARHQAALNVLSLRTFVRKASPLRRFLR